MDRHEEKLTLFRQAFRTLQAGNEPFTWQERLFVRLCGGDVPAALDLPTGLGKTSVMAVWLIARALADDAARKCIPRRLVYVVDRRAVVDQATEEAKKIREGLGKSGLKLTRLGLAEKSGEESDLPISTLRGQHADNREWLADPAACAIVVGTIDMIGSRLLFQGYGVSRGMRPMQAALLSTDTLIVLDEAHLVPPFETLLKMIAGGEQKLWPYAVRDGMPIPRLRLMSLSATGREKKSTKGTNSVFRLLQEDEKDELVAKRIKAAKRVKIEDVEPSALVKTMAERAWERAEGRRNVIVFCNSRVVAQKIHDELEAKLNKLLKEVPDKNGVDPAQYLELIVGARRVRERERLAESEVFKRFSPKNAKENGTAEGDVPSFLVCTSAGEVGVDIDADHMVCDLVPWERMVQRLGRVNRRGDFTGGSLVDVFAVLPDKDAESSADDERIKQWLKPFKYPEWPSENGRRNASPKTLLDLREDEKFRKLCLDATTPTPLHPKLTREHLDAWSMTSLKEHPGRAEIQPWLRGWIEDVPQTELLWRRHLPVRRGEGNVGAKAALNEFMEDAPPHISEILEDRADSVARWLEARAKKSLKLRTEEEVVEQPQDSESDERPEPLQPDSVVVVLLTPRNEIDRLLRLEEIEEIARRKQLYSLLANSRVILDARLGGLDSAGLLDAGVDSLPPTLDGDPGAEGGWDEERLKAAGFRVRRIQQGREETDGWKTGYWRLVNAEREEAGELDVAYEWRVEVWRGGRSTRGDMAISRTSQLLSEHRDEVVAAVGRIADALGIGDPYRQMLADAADCHDSGKARAIWQRYAGNVQFAHRQKDALAKFGKRSNPALLKIGRETYRHEFGSLRDAIKNGSLSKIADEGLRDLALHLIAAHHGHARPVIAPVDPDVAPSASVEAARQAALRFARLQQNWGPWGLAWWESLLRAADMAASREHDRKAAPTEKAADGKTAGKMRETA